MAIVLLSVLVAIDQGVKWWGYSKLKVVGSIEVIKNVFNLTYVENKGAAFGILQGARSFFLILTVIVLGIIFVMYKQEKNKWLKLIYIFMAAGAIGNAIDRLLRGYVVDMFEFAFINFPVFNVADMYLVLSLILFIFLTITGKNLDSSQIQGGLDD